MLIKIAFAAVALAMFPAQAATTVEDPVKFVEGVYNKLATLKDYREPDDIYTPHLSRLFALEKKDAGGEVGRMDFDFWTNAQDWKLSGVSVKGFAVEGSKSREIVVAKFKNGERKETIRFYFEQRDEGWKLDDVSSAGADPWTLSLILKYGWLSEK